MTVPVSTLLDHQSPPSHSPAPLCRSFQGQEERVIFISTVLSRPETLPPAPAATGSSGAADAADSQHTGFWRNPRRFNVAITRAKALLGVVGHPSVLVEDASWRELLRRVCVCGGGGGGAAAWPAAACFTCRSAVRVKMQ